MRMKYDFIRTIDVRVHAWPFSAKVFLNEIERRTVALGKPFKCGCPRLTFMASKGATGGSCVRMVGEFAWNSP